MPSTAGALPQTASNDELAGVYAQRIMASLPLMWARRVSMHDHRGAVRWQSEQLSAPAEHEAVRLALEQFVGQSAPARADHELPGQRTAVLLRAADVGNVMRGFIMLVVDNRRLRGKGKSAHDLPIPVQRAAHEWAVKLSNQAATRPNNSAPAELTAVQADRLLAFGPSVDEPQADEIFARLLAFPVALVAQPLLALQRGMRIRRYEVLLREGGDRTEGAPPPEGAPLALLREADDRGLGTVLDRRVAGSLVVWLSKRSERFVDEPAQFSINLSGSSLADPNFLHFVQLCMAKAQIAPSLIAFEVDQSYWFSQRDSLHRLGQEIAALGAGLVIDNCSLERSTPEMFSLPGLRLAKIDPQLTCDLATNSAAQLRIAGIAQMARVGGVHTVAKRVVLSEQQELLHSLGVDFAQGYATAQAVSLEELDRQREQNLIIDEAVRDISPEAL